MITAKTVAINFFWRFLERSGAQLVSFFISIILARLLEPSVYGEIALVCVFTSILEVFIDSGFGAALIQKKNADDLDYSSVFWFNIFVCFLLYIAFFCAAPFIAAFFNLPHLTPVVRVLGLTMLVSGGRNVLQAYVSKKMIFKKFFFATMGATLCSAAVGAFMAYCGYGVWTLVWQYLISVICSTFVLWLTVRWRPKFIFSIHRLKSLFWMEAICVFAH